MKNSHPLSLEEHLRMKGGFINMCEQPRLLPRCDCLIVAFTLFQRVLLGRLADDREAGVDGWGKEMGEVMSALMRLAEFWCRKMLFLKLLFLLGNSDACGRDRYYSSNIRNRPFNCLRPSLCGQRPSI